MRNLGDLAGVASALKNPDISKISFPANCFEALTSDDRRFIAQLQATLTRACPSTRIPLGSPPENCLPRAKQDWDSALRSFQSRFGTAALERVLTAINANVKRHQMAAALKSMKQPEVRPKFEAFSRRMLEYYQAMKRATHRDDGNDPDAPSFLVRTKRYFGMMADGLAYKARPFSGTSNPIADLKAAQDRLYSARDEFKEAVRKHKSERESASLLAQTDQVVADLDWKAVHSRDQFFETRSALQTGAAALGSAALVVASAGAVAPAVMTESALASGLLSAGSGAAGGAGISGLEKVAEFGLKAKADSDNKGTRFLCELSHRVANDGKRAINEAFTNAVYGAGFGFGIGAGTGLLVSRLPSIGPLIAALGGAGMAASTGVSAVAGISNRMAREAQRKAEYKSLLADRRTSAGEALDRKYKHDLERASDSAKNFESAVTIGTIAAGAASALRGQSRKAGATEPSNAAAAGPDAGTNSRTHPTNSQTPSANTPSKGIYSPGQFEESLRAHGLKTAENSGGRYLVPEQESATGELPSAIKRLSDRFKLDFEIQNPEIATAHAKYEEGRVKVPIHPNEFTNTDKLALKIRNLEENITRLQSSENPYFEKTLIGANLETGDASLHLKVRGDIKDGPLKWIRNQAIRHKIRLIIDDQTVDSVGGAAAAIGTDVYLPSRFLNRPIEEFKHYVAHELHHALAVRLCTQNPARCGHVIEYRPADANTKLTKDSLYSRFFRSDEVEANTLSYHFNYKNNDWKNRALEMGENQLKWLRQLRSEIVAGMHSLTEAKPQIEITDNSGLLTFLTGPKKIKITLPVESTFESNDAAKSFYSDLIARRIKAIEFGLENIEDFRDIGGSKK